MMKLFWRLETGVVADYYALETRVMAHGRVDTIKFRPERSVLYLDHSNSTISRELAVICIWA